MMRVFRYGILMALPYGIAWNVSLAQQEKPELAGANYQNALQAWTDLDRQIDKAYESLCEADLDEQDEAKTRYAELVVKANEMLPKLRAVAMDAYRSAPNEDRQLTRLLVGIVANDVRRDNYEPALETAQLLIDNQCSVKAIYLLGGKAAYCMDEFDLSGKLLEQAEENGAIDNDGSKYLQDISETKKRWQDELNIRAAEAAADDLPRVKLSTNKGDIVVELFENEAPQAVANFIHLVQEKFYNGLTFHRVLPAFMAQGGCPHGDGQGGPGWNIRCECYQDNHRKHFRGALSMAHAGRDSGGSQFFITLLRTSHLDGKHTVFGRVIDGFEVLPRIQRRNPPFAVPLPTPDQIITAEVLRKRDHEYVPNKITPQQPKDERGK